MILWMQLLLLSPLLGLSAWAAETRASESSRPRGVGPECENTSLTTLAQCLCVEHTSCILAPWKAVTDLAF